MQKLCSTQAPRRLKVVEAAPSQVEFGPLAGKTTLVEGDDSTNAAKVTVSGRATLSTTCRQGVQSKVRKHIYIYIDIDIYRYTCILSGWETRRCRLSLGTLKPHLVMRGGSPNPWCMTGLGALKMKLALRVRLFPKKSCPFRQDQQGTLKKNPGTNP